jgi:hypothetical protein
MLCLDGYKSGLHFQSSLGSFLSQTCNFPIVHNLSTNISTSPSTPLPSLDHYDILPSSTCPSTRSIPVSTLCSFFYCYRAVCIVRFEANACLDFRLRERNQNVALHKSRLGVSHLHDVYGNSNDCVVRQHGQNDLGQRRSVRSGLTLSRLPKLSHASDHKTHRAHPSVALVHISICIPPHSACTSSNPSH